MKYKIFFWIFVILFTINVVNASPLDINLAKNNYASGETLQAELIINSIENEQISMSDIKLIDNSFNNIAITPFVNKIGDNYYVYFILPFNLNKGNYSLIVKNVIYFNNGLLVQKDVSKVFSIVEKDFVLSIDPGIIIANDLENQNSFDINLNNYGEIVDVKFESDSDFLTTSEDNISLVDEFTLKLYVSDYLISSFGKKHLFVNYGNYSYDIPVWLGESFDDNGTENISDDNKTSLIFLTQNDHLSFYFDKGLSKYISIEFQNIGDDDINNIDFSLEGNISEISELKFNKFDKLSSGEIAKEIIFLNKNKDALGYYSGNLIMNEGQNVEKFSIDVYFLENLNVTNDKVNDSNIESGDLDDYVPENRFKINYWVLFVIIFVIMIIIIYIMYIKYKKKKQVKFPFSR